MAVTYRIDLPDEHYEELTTLLRFSGGRYRRLLKHVEDAEYRPSIPEERLAFDVGAEARRMRRRQDHQTGFWFQR